MENLMIGALSLKTAEEVEEELATVRSMIDEAETTDELLSIDEMLGVSDYVGIDDGWEHLAEFLRKLRSPYAQIIQDLANRWEDIEEVC